MHCLQEDDNTLNAISGEECGYFLPAQSSQGAARERALIVSNETITAVIAVDFQSQIFGSSYGYVSAYNYGRLNMYTLTTDVNLALRVTIPPGAGVSISAVSPPDGSHPYLGAVVNSNNENNVNDLSGNSINSAWLSGTGHSEPHTPASNIGNSVANTGFGYNGPAESSVWQIQEGANSELFGLNALVAVWTNSGGSAITAQIAWSQAQNFFVLTGSYSQLQGDFPFANYKTVYFTAVPV